MKKITNNIYGYICYITDFKNPINVFATFCRILVYFRVFSHIILGDSAAIDLIVFFINCLATTLAISGYIVHRKNNSLEKKVIIKIASKEFSKKLNNKRKNTIESYEEMSKEEKIEVLESFIKTLEDTIESAKRELEELRNEE